MKYRLIKRYPGLPDFIKKNTLVFLSKSGFYYPASGSMFESAFTLSKTQVENYPEFWQKVTQCCEKDTDFDGNCPIHRAEKIVIHESNIPKKEYEILSIMTPNKVLISHPSIIEAYEIADWYIDCSINSIKRLSDGIIFTVGDKVNNLNNPHSWNIKKISIEKGDIRLDANSGGVCPNFQQLQHSKKLLFTTSDGVEIFEGDRYYAVNKSSFKKISALGCSISGKDDRNYIDFSKESKAEEYILKNKPCLSYEDVMKLGGFNKHVFDIELRSLIAKKL